MSGECCLRVARSIVTSAAEADEPQSDRADHDVADRTTSEEGAAPASDRDFIVGRGSGIAVELQYGPDPHDRFQSAASHDFTPLRLFAQLRNYGQWFSFRKALSRRWLIMKILLKTTRRVR